MMPLTYGIATMYIDWSRLQYQLLYVLLSTFSLLSVLQKGTPTQQQNGTPVSAENQAPALSQKLAPSPPQKLVPAPLKKLAPMPPQKLNDISFPRRSRSTESDWYVKLFITIKWGDQNFFISYFINFFCVLV